MHKIKRLRSSKQIKTKKRSEEFQLPDLVEPLGLLLRGSITRSGIEKWRRSSEPSLLSEESSGRSGRKFTHLLMYVILETLRGVKEIRNSPQMVTDEDKQIFRSRR